MRQMVVGTLGGFWKSGTWWQRGTPTPPQPHTVKFACTNWKVASNDIEDLAVRFVWRYSIGTNYGQRREYRLRSLDPVCPSQEYFGSRTSL